MNVPQKFPILRNQKLMNKFNYLWVKINIQYLNILE